MLVSLSGVEDLLQAKQNEFFLEKQVPVLFG